MTKTSITLRFDFAAGHTITGHPGGCARCHGHTYEGEVTISGPLNELGMVLDFAEVKVAVKAATSKFDHHFLIWQNDPRAQDLWRLDPDSVVPLPFQPTAELLAEALMLAIRETLEPIGETLQVERVILWETPSSRATVERS